MNDSIPHGDIGGWRLDDVVSAGTLGTATMQRTGHVLSLPEPATPDPRDSETFVPYCFRVSKQCGIADGHVAANTVGALYARTTGALADKSNWPELADKFWNPVWTPEERAAEEAKLAAWGHTTAKLKRRDRKQGGVV